MLNQVCGNMSVLSRIQLILSLDLIRQVYVVEILCGRMVQNFYSNLGNDLLNKIYVYENGDSFKKIYYLEIQKHSSYNSVSTFSSEQKLYRVTSYVTRFIKNLERN